MFDSFFNFVTSGFNWFKSFFSSFFVNIALVIGGALAAFFSFDNIAEKVGLFVFQKTISVLLASFIIAFELFLINYFLNVMTFEIFNNLSLFDYISTFFISNNYMALLGGLLKKIGILSILVVSFYIAIVYFVIYEWRRIFNLLIGVISR